MSGSPQQLRQFLLFSVLGGFRLDRKLAGMAPFSQALQQMELTSLKQLQRCIIDCHRRQSPQAVKGRASEPPDHTDAASCQRGQSVFPPPG